MQEQHSLQPSQKCWLQKPIKSRSDWECALNETKKKVSIVAKPNPTLILVYYDPCLARQTALKIAEIKEP